MNINRLFTGLYNSKLMTSLVDWSVKDSTRVKDNSGKFVNNTHVAQPHIEAFIGTFSTALYFVNGYKNKDIPPESRRTLLINSTLCGVFGVLGGYALSNIINRFKDKAVNRFDEIMVKNQKNQFLRKGLISIVPMLGFTMIFRYIGPVIATPLADKINGFLVKHYDKKKDSNLSKIA